MLTLVHPASPKARNARPVMIPRPSDAGFPVAVKVAGLFLGAGFTPAEVRASACWDQSVLDAARAMEHLLARGVTARMCAVVHGLTEA